ncbi:MAG: SAM-dependent methyltransferase [Ahrensia sp.]|nr:SAM-dependent methyltransferase [Ahrensia sp.]
MLSKIRTACPVTSTSRHLTNLHRARMLFREGDDVLIRLAVEDSLDRLAAVNRSFDHAIALFGRTALLADALSNSQQIGEVQRIEETIHLGEADRIATPDSLGLAPESTDCVIAPLSLHFAEDLPGSLIQIQQALRPDGLLLASLPGPETLKELRAVLLHAESDLTGGAAARVDAFTDIRDAGALLQRCGFALPVVDAETLTLRYDNLSGLMRDLRRFGATSRIAAPSLSRRTLERANELYAQNHADPDGRIRASFQTISMSGWKPHASQQKPLAPGSAQVSLTKVLSSK